MIQRRYLSGASLFAIGLTCILAFQNCQEFVVSDEVSLSDSLAVQYRAEDEKTIRELNSLAEFVAHYQGVPLTDGSHNVVGARNRVHNVLYPDSSFDLERISADVPQISYDDLGGGRFVVKQQYQSSNVSQMGTSTADNFISDEFSVVMVVRTPITGDILSINSGDRKVDDLQISVDAGIVKAIHYTSSNEYAVSSVALPDQEFLVVAATFGVEANKTRIMVNGRLGTEAVITGSPASNEMVSKQLVLGASSDTGQINWGEVKVFFKEVSPYQMSALSRDMSARWSIPNMIDDPSLREKDTSGVTVNPLFAAAQQVIDAKCVSCHTSAGISWGRSVASYKSRGLFVAGDPAASLLIRCATRANLGGACASMPAVSLSTSEMSALTSWIQSEK